MFSEGWGSAGPMLAARVWNARETRDAVHCAGEHRCRNHYASGTVLIAFSARQILNRLDGRKATDGHAPCSISPAGRRTEQRASQPTRPGRPHWLTSSLTRRGRARIDHDEVATDTRPLPRGSPSWGSGYLHRPKPTSLTSTSTVRKESPGATTCSLAANRLAAVLRIWPSLQTRY